MDQQPLRPNVVVIYRDRDRVRHLEGRLLWETDREIDVELAATATLPAKVITLSRTVIDRIERTVSGGEVA